eukprot:7807863-Alexandrium_andersonii.AAC.1
MQRTRKRRARPQAARLSLWAKERKRRPTQSLTATQGLPRSAPWRVGGSGAASHNTLGHGKH